MTLEKVIEIAKKYHGHEPEYFERHVKVVAAIAKEMAQDYDADEDTVEKAAYLHDIGRKKEKETGNKIHHQILGAEIAEKELKELGYDAGLIKNIVSCIRSHSLKGMNPESQEAKIVAAADAIALYDVKFLVEGIAAEFIPDIKGQYEWSRKKLESDWENKLTLLPGLQEKFKDQYKQALERIDGLYKKD